MNFDEAVKFILGAEGGYVFDPHDPGGETNYGISKRSYPHLNIRSLTKDDATEIYKADYWTRCRCDELPAVMRLSVFDCSVVQGRYFAITLLQKLGGTLADGIIGPKTLFAVKDADKRMLIDYQTMRVLHFASLDNFKRYGKGWTRRILRVATYPGQY